MRSETKRRGAMRQWLAIAVAVSSICFSHAAVGVFVQAFDPLESTWLLDGVTSTSVNSSLDYLGRGLVTDGASANLATGELTAFVDSNNELTFYAASSF